jgi:hypothetical protein
MGKRNNSATYMQQEGGRDGVGEKGEDACPPQGPQNLTIQAIAGIIDWTVSQT